MNEKLKGIIVLFLWLSSGVNCSELHVTIYGSTPTILSFFMATAKIFQRVQGDLLGLMQLLFREVK